MIVKDSHVVITGGSRGLGRATAEFLASRGATITITYRSDLESAGETQAAIRDLGVSCEVVQMDLTSGHSIADFTAKLAKLRPVDVLINNAGEIPRPGNWDQLVGDDLDRTIGANLTGHIRVIQGVVPLLASESCIINIVSSYGIIGAGAVMAYTAAKAGMIIVTQSLARELGARGVRVNAIAPGNFDTAMATEAGTGVADWVISTAPIARLGRPSEIGQAAAYLIEAGYVTGTTHIVDGGQILNI